MIKTEEEYKTEDIIDILDQVQAELNAIYKRIGFSGSNVLTRVNKLYAYLRIKKLNNHQFKHVEVGDEEIYKQFPSGLGEKVVIDDACTYGETLRNNWYRQEGAKWMREQLPAKTDLNFAEWFAKNYSWVKTLYKKEELSAWVHVENGILVNGSDLHYAALINQHGVTVGQACERYLKEPLPAQPNTERK